MKKKIYLYLLLFLCTSVFAQDLPTPDDDQNIEINADEPLAADINSNIAVLFVAATSLGWYLLKRRKQSF